MKYDYVSDIVKDDGTNPVINIKRWKMPPKIFLMILVWKVYISLEKNVEKKIFFWISTFFAPKIGQFFMKNGKICVAFEKWLSTLDDFEGRKGAKIVFLFFLCKGIYIWSRSIPLKMIFWAIRTLCTRHTKKRACCAGIFFWKKITFLDITFFEIQKINEKT